MYMQRSHYLQCFSVFVALIHTTGYVSHDDVQHQYIEQIESPCDPGWPQFVRLNVILDWTFSEIWQFIDMLHLPYVHLYDEGYVVVVMMMVMT